MSPNDEPLSCDRAPRDMRHMVLLGERVDLHPDIAEFLRKYVTGKKGLLFPTTNRTPHLNRNLEARWLTPDSKRWIWTRGEWAGTPSNDSEKRGSAVNAAWNTSTISGWGTPADYVGTLLAPSRRHTGTTQ